MRTKAIPDRRAKRQLTATAIAIAGLCVATASATAGGGGIDVPSPPRVSDVVCIETCAGVRKATEGSRIELSGRNLAAVEQVSFKAAAGPRVTASPSAISERSVTARVPEDAATGAVRVRDGYGNVAASPVDLRIVRPNQIPEAGTFALRAVRAKPRRAFFGAARSPSVRYTFSGDGATDIRIDVISRADGGLVSSFVARARQPYTANTASWDGLIDGGRPAPDGAYRFRVGPVSGTGDATTKDARFSLYGHKFPVRARHSYGDGFGAGRRHQGQDVFARCGTRLVAARAGRVSYRGYHSAAGHYVVVDGKRTNLDYMYAHLQRRAPVRAGQRVSTGQRIGAVGDTGNASGCHLHFEIWRGAWHQGGTALPAVTRMLRAWDSWS